jgi:hypothetical protein
MQTQVVSLQELQRQIFREKVLRARGMSEAERFAETLELIETGYTAMRGGVRIQHPEATAEETERLLRERVGKLRRLEDRDLFIYAAV